MVTPTIPTTVPTEMRSGDTVKFKKRWSEYLVSDSWTLTFYVSSRYQRISVTATDNGDGCFLVTVPAATTTDMHHGDWKWQLVVSKSGEVFTLETGHVEVLPGYSTVGSQGIDDRTLAEKMVEELETLLPDTAANDQTSISVDGYSATFSDKSELIRSYRYWKDVLEQEKQADRVRRGMGSGQRVKLRFG